MSGWLMTKADLMLTFTIFFVLGLALLGSLLLNIRLRRDLQTASMKLSKTLNAYKLVMVRMSEQELSETLMKSQEKPRRKKSSGSKTLFQNEDAEFSGIQGPQPKTRKSPSSSLVCPAPRTAPPPIPSAR